MSQTDELKQFVKRRRQGQNVRVGVMYAQVVPDGRGEVTLGFSLCSKSDHFCPIEAEDRAFDRSLAYVDRPPYIRGKKNLIPDSMKTDMSVFIGRAERFFGNPNNGKATYKLPEWAAHYYEDHKVYVDRFFAKLARKKAALIAKEAPTNE